jgi:hypothetical protein
MDPEERVSGGAGRVAPRRIGSFASMLAVIGFAAFATPALGAWSAPVDVSTSAANPQVATDADGDSALTWEFGISGGRVQARTMSPTTVLGPVKELGATSDTSDRTPQVAIDARGDSVFVWVNSSFVSVRSLSAEGTLTGNTLTNCTCSAPQVATDTDGDSVFTWVNNSSFFDARVQARTMTKRGVLGPLRNVSPAGEIGTHPQVATDDSGDSVITWVLEDGVDGDNDIVQARTLTVNGSLGPIKDLSAPAGRAFAPQVASDSDGDAVFTWLRFDGSWDQVQGRTMTPTGTLGTTFNLTSGGPSSRDPQVDTDANGDSVFTWERVVSPDSRVQAKTRIGGVVSGVTNLSAAGGEAFAPQVASADSGAAVLTWLRFDGTNDRVQGRPMTAAGAFGTTTTLSAAGSDAQTPQVAIAATNGKAAATWELGGTPTAAGTVQAVTGP